MHSLGWVRGGLEGILLRGVAAYCQSMDKPHDFDKDILTLGAGLVLLGWGVTRLVPRPARLAHLLWEMRKLSRE